MPWSEAAGIRLWYVDAGSGPPLVLVHGLGGSSADWESQVAEFARDHRVIAPDLRGYGMSERRGPFAVKQFAADVGALLDELGIGRCILVGHSMGGAVAMQLALDDPQRIDKLVLTNTLPSFRPRGLEQRLMLWSRLVLMSLFGPGRLGRRVAAQLYPGPELAALRDRAGERSARNGRRVYLATLWQLARWSAQERLRELRMPTLVMAAERDYFDSALFRRFIAELPDNAVSEVFAGTRHGLPLEAPQRFNARLRSFLGAAA
jgi:pimeloyl-ACP methyl ester carboxylesterase